MQKQLRSVFFTLNNPPEGWRLKETDVMKGGIYQIEKGEEGTPHVQGVVFFKKRLAWNIAKGLISPDAHIEPVKSAKHAVAYCSKVETRIDGPWKFGEFPSPGTRSDLEDVKTAIKNGSTKRDLMEEFSMQVAKYPRFIQEYVGIVKAKNVSIVSPDALVHTWQKDLIGIMEGTPDRRLVHWYWSDEGCTGKSLMATYLQDHKNAFVIDIAKTSDVAYAYSYEKIVVFDMPRMTEESIFNHIYYLVECFKNGRIFSAKYESQVKRFDPPHVVVFANSRPDTSKLSSDRWNIVCVDF